MTTSRSPVPRRLLGIIALVVLLIAVVPAVSANEIIYDEPLEEFIYTGKSGVQTASGTTSYFGQPVEVNTIFFEDITLAQNINYLIFEIPGDHGYWVGNHTYIENGEYDFIYQFNNKDCRGKLYLNRKTNFLGQVTSTQFTIFLDTWGDWDIGDLIGTQFVRLPFCFVYDKVPYGTISKETNTYLCWRDAYNNQYPPVESSIKIVEVTWIDWKHHVTVEEDIASYFININGLIDDVHYTSQVNFIKGGQVVSNFTNYGEDFQWTILKRDIDLLEVISPSGKVYSYPLESDIPDEPTPTLRTGTVTMTDHNGTTISGFEVKAVNYYTGEEYTVSTDTDVATITLPMDRTISLRNPQTGQYEDVPVGYYLFYGYKSGYKMTNEEGIRISVLPEQYQGSYQLCDIIVTSEDGYLTGKHQFQIRSRADLRILQTGTISAQSATTGEWFNTTVVDGIATLILPYDTSDSISPYVGNYYVYATSPGYIPSEYPTQISVRPDTQSEIRSILLTPIGGIPEAGNVTLRIQVISDSGQGIPNAEIHIDGVDGAGWEVWDTYTASSSGYLEVSVYENSTYDIIVYATGYYDSGTRIEVGNTDPPLMEFKLYPTAPTLTPTTQPTGWVTPPPTTQPPPGIPDEDDDSEGFLMEAIRGISKAFGVGFATGKTIFGMLLALAIGFATAKQLRGGAAEFSLGLLGGTMLGVLIGLLPIWVVVVLLLVVGMYIGYRYVGGSNNG